MDRHLTGPFFGCSGLLDGSGRFRGLSTALARHLHTLTAGLFATTALSFNAYAQDEPVLDCTPLDSLQATVLPQEGLELTTANPSAISFLDSDPGGVTGGFRNLTFGPLVVGAGPSTDAELMIGPAPVGLILISNGPNALAPLSILYDANSAGLMLDLSATGSISVNVVDNDQPNTALQLVLTDMSNNTAQVSTSSLPGSINGDTLPQDVVFPIESFTDVGTIDLSRIFSIEVAVSPTVNGADLVLGGSEICEEALDPDPDPVPDPDPMQPVPALSTYALIFLATLFIFAGAVRFRAAGTFPRRPKGPGRR